MRWSPPQEALPPARAERQDWQTLRTLLPYLWAYKGRVLFALGCLVAAKLATVAVPILLKDIVDRLAPSTQAAAGLLVVPVALVVGYGLLRLSTSLFTELREFFFVNVTQAAMRTLAQLSRRKHEVTLFHVLDPAEIEFPYEDPTLFLSLEDDRTVEANGRDVGKGYRALVQEWLARVKREAAEADVDYALCRTDRPLDEVLLPFLARRERSAA